MAHAEPEAVKAGVSDPETVVVGVCINDAEGVSDVVLDTVSDRLGEELPHNDIRSVTVSEDENEVDAEAHNVGDEVAETDVEPLGLPQLLALNVDEGHGDAVTLVVVVGVNATVVVDVGDAERHAEEDVEPHTVSDGVAHAVKVAHWVLVTDSVLEPHPLNVALDDNVAAAEAL